MCTEWGTVGAGRGERFAGESYVKGEAGQMTDYKFGTQASVAPSLRPWGSVMGLLGY
jgi:hypothetical protein